MRRALLPAAVVVAVPLAVLGPSLAAGAPLPLNYLRFFPPFRGSPGFPNWHPLWFDGVGQFLVWRKIAGDALREGIFPLWNPYAFCGQPFLANGQSALLYPPTWLFALSGPLLGFSLCVLFHLLAAAFGTFLWLRKRGLGEVAALFGGLSYALSAPLVLRVPVLSHLCVASLLPWCLLGVDAVASRRDALSVSAFGVVMALPALAGHLQMAAFVWLAALLYAAFGLRGKRAVLGFISGVALALLFALPQILPSLELSKVSHRAAAPSLQGWRFFKRTGLHPAMLLTLLAPDAFGEPFWGEFFGPSDYVEGAGYAGATALALFLLGLFVRRGEAKFLAALGGLSVLVALATPVALPLYLLMPASATPSRALFLWAFSYSCLGALGLDGLFEGLFERRRRLVAAVGATGAFGALLLLAVGLWGEGLEAALPLGAAGSLALAAGLVLIGAGAVAVGPRKTLLLALVALQIADLSAFGARKIPRGERADFYRAVAALERLKKLVRKGRVCGLIVRWPLQGRPIASLPPNLAALGGLGDIAGYDSLHLMAYRQLLAALQGREPSPPENGNICALMRFSPKALQALGAGAFLGPMGSVVNLQASRPLVFLPRRTVFFENWGEAAKYLGSPGFDPLEEATVVDGGLEGGSGRATRAEVRRDGLRADVRVERRGVAVLLVPAAPGVKVWVDGKPIKPKIADIALLCVPLPEGEHKIAAVYHPASFEVGLFVALLTAALCVGTWMMLRVRGRCA